MFTDTLKADVVSWHRRDRYPQVFLFWVRLGRRIPRSKKTEAHEGLSLLAQRDGVPPTCVMDGSKEETMGEVRRKARQMNIRIKQAEPYSPWQNAAEGAIREVKRIAGHSYELQGQGPETIVSWQTVDISPFVKCGWYN
jgi:transposase